MRYQEFIANIRKKTLPNYSVYTFSGVEWFLKEKGIELLKSILPDISNEIITFKPDTFSTANLMNELYAMPFFKQKRLIVFALPEDKELQKEIEKLLTDYLKNPSEYAILIIKTDKALNLSHKLLLNIECEPLTYSESPQWVVSQVKANGKSITPSLARLLVQYTGNDLNRIDEVIQKLVLFVGKRETIEEQDVRSLVDVRNEGEINNLVNYIRDGKTSAALEELERLLGMGESVEKIIGFLGWYFRTNPSKKQADNLSKLLQADIAIKTSLLPEDLALKMLIVQVTSR